MAQKVAGRQSRVKRASDSMAFDGDRPSPFLPRVSLYEEAPSIGARRLGIPIAATLSGQMAAASPARRST
eukprot:2608843-Prymnesium_polylepis.3